MPTWAILILLILAGVVVVFGVVRLYGKAESDSGGDKRELKGLKEIAKREERARQERNAPLPTGPSLVRRLRQLAARAADRRKR